MPVVWDDSLKERVKALWPTHSSREIADTISSTDCFVSHHSVSGMAARMGLTATQKTRDTSNPNPFGLLSDGRRKKPAIDGGLTGRFYADDVSTENVHGVAALESHHCRFIINTDMAAPIYCGAKITHDRFSWCQKHHERCCGVGTVGERNAA